MGSKLAYTVGFVTALIIGFFAGYHKGLNQASEAYEEQMKQLKRQLSMGRFR